MILKLKTALFKLKKFWFENFAGNEVMFEAKDLPDPRDYRAGMPAVRYVPLKVDLLKKAEKFGFKILKQSQASCTAYARVHGALIENAISNQTLPKISAKKQWQWQLLTGASTDRGDWIRNAHRQYHLHPQGFPDAPYSFISEKNRVMKMIKWLARGRTLNTVITWAGKNWFNLNKTGIYSRDFRDKPFNAHAICLVGYNQKTEMFKAICSLDRQYGENQRGVLYIPFAEVSKLGSVIVAHDLKDKEFHIPK